jgi:hypothetical protein
MDASTGQTISQVALALGIMITAVAGYGAFHYGKINEHEQAKMDQEAQQAERKKSNDELIEAIRKIVSSASPAQQDPADHGLPGFSLTALFTFHYQNHKRDKYIFDMGDALDRNRVSLHLDVKGNLIYRIIDGDRVSHIVMISPSLMTFQMETKYLVSCDYGLSPTYSFMRLFINGKEVGRMEKRDLLKLAFKGPGTTKPLIMMADMNGQNNSKLTVGFFTVSRAAFAKQDYEKMGHLL